MKIGVLGTGTVGRTLASKLAALVHAVMIGTRDPAQTLARTGPDGMGGPPFSEWASQNPGVHLGTFAETIGFGEMILNATNGSGTLDALAQAGTASLNGKVLVDVSNPLDFSQGMPPRLFVSNTDSLAEQIQRAYPAAMVVKALNMVTAALMVDPRQLGEGDHTTFICGNSAIAKTRVSGLLVSFGWTDIIDLGDLSAARGMEMYLPLWLRMWGSLGTGMINVKVVR